MRKPCFLPLLTLVVIPSIAWAQQEPQIQLSLGQQSVPFVRITAGRFVMGSPPTEANRNNDETAHSVTLSSGFYMAKTPVTVGVWKEFVSATGYRSEAEKGTSGGSGWDGKALVQKPEFNWKNPGFVQTDEHPVTIITYDDALAFTQWATQVTNRSVTLPTEAQWEYAYRAGTTTTYYDAKAPNATALGWFKENAGQGTKPVGQKKPNAWGLVDMPGNVWQWCLDWYAAYPTGDVTDPLQNVPDMSEKARRVVRGGSWLKDSKNGRAAARFRNAPGSRNADTGFRLVVLDQAPSIPAATPPPVNNNTSPKPQPVRSAPEPEESSSSPFNWLRYFVPATFIGILIYIFSSRSKSSNQSSRGGSKGGSGSSFSGRSSNIRLSSSDDGFWVDASPMDSGRRITVRYRTHGSINPTYMDVVCTGQRQFVYTGFQPDDLALDNTASSSSSSSFHDSHTSPSPAWNSSNDDNNNYNNSSSSSNFHGYPSAY